MDKIIGNIYETYDYSKFKKLLGNRNINHVKAIIESIKTYGDLGTAIIVNEKYEIVDGQHRYDARKELGLPIFYEIKVGFGIKECIAMNTSSLNWSLEDYINCYAEYGYKDYILLREIESEYSNKLPKALIRSIVSGTFASIPNSKIKKGVFECKTEEFQIHNILDYIASFSMPKKIRGNIKLLYYVFRFCYESELVDNTRLYQQWEKNNCRIEGVTDIKQAAEVVEDIYNYHCKNIVYIATEYRKAAAEKCASIPGGGRSGWENEK